LECTETEKEKQSDLGRGGYRRAMSSIIFSIEERERERGKDQQQQKKKKTTIYNSMFFSFSHDSSRIL
jgi:hypothetical protein